MSYSAHCLYALHCVMIVILKGNLILNEMKEENVLHFIFKTKYTHTHTTHTNLDLFEIFRLDRDFNINSIFFRH